MTRSVTRMPRYPPQPCAHVVRRPSDGTAPGSVDSWKSPRAVAGAIVQLHQPGHRRGWTRHLRHPFLAMVRFPRAREHLTVVNGPATDDYGDRPVRESPQFASAELVVPTLLDGP